MRHELLTTVFWELSRVKMVPEQAAPFEPPARTGQAADA